MGLGYFWTDPATSWLYRICKNNIFSSKHMISNIIVLCFKEVGSNKMIYVLFRK